MDKKKIAGVIATAAAVAFITSPILSTAVHAAAKVKCYGVNKCKGKSACKTAKSTCKGHNKCKGQGYVMKTAKECDKLKGTTTEPTS